MKYITTFNRLILISLVFLGLSVSSANAASIIGSPTAATGISGLEIGNTKYDVAFIPQLCGIACDNPLFFTDDTSAEEAMTEVMGFLNIQNIFFEDIAGTTGSDGLLVLVTDTASGVWRQALLDGEVGVAWYGVNVTDLCNDPGFSECLNFLTSPDIDLTYLKFSLAAAVPVPAAVWLFGSALLGLIGYRKRKTVAV